MATIVSEQQTQEEEAKVKIGSVNLSEYFKEVKSEFFKITWPSREQATREFFSVILLVAILTGTIYLIDKIFGVIASFFTGKF